MYSLKTILMLVATATLLYACSGDSDKETKPGKIETMTKEMGQEAVRVIKSPIEKAQAVADEEAKRAQEMDERKDQ
jgi:hypothetical protein